MIKNMYVVLLFGILFGVVLAMPFQSGSNVIVSGDGGGGDCCNPFNQDLNTTDNVHFNRINTTDYINTNDSYYMDGNELIFSNDYGSYFFGTGIGDPATSNSFGIGKNSFSGSGGGNTYNYGFGDSTFKQSDNVDYCTAVGFYSMYGNDQSMFSTAVGYSAGIYGNDNDYTTNIGAYAGRNFNAKYAMNLGYKAGEYSDDDYTFNAGQSAGGRSSGDNNYGLNIGYYAGYYIDDCYRNSFIGPLSGYYSDENDNSFFGGSGSGRNSNDCDESLGLGYQSMHTSDNCDGSAFIGYESGKNSENIADSVSIGKESGAESEYANKSIFVGSRSGYNHIGDYCMYLGQGAGMNLNEENMLRIKMETINRDDLIAGNFSNGHVAINTSTVSSSYTLDVNGEIECTDIDTTSDMRAKIFIGLLPDDGVKQFCENISIWLFEWRIYGFNTENETYYFTRFIVNDTYIDNETGELVEIGYNETFFINTSHTTDLYFGNGSGDFDIGIPAQLLHWYLTDSFGEGVADMMVHVPENESVELWNVNYRALTLVFNRYSQILAQEQKQQEQRITDLETRVDAMEEFLMQYGYVPPE